MYIVHVMSKSAAQAIIRAKERGRYLFIHVHVHLAYRIAGKFGKH